MSAPKTAALREFSIQAPPGLDLPAIVSDVIALLHVERGIEAKVIPEKSTAKRVRIATRFLAEKELVEEEDEPAEVQEAEGAGDEEE
jgi:hypothetical protein